MWLPIVRPALLIVLIGNRPTQLTQERHVWAPYISPSLWSRSQHQWEPIAGRFVRKMYAPYNHLWHGIACLVSAPSKRLAFEEEKQLPHVLHVTRSHFSSWPMAPKHINPPRASNGAPSIVIEDKTRRWLPSGDLSLRIKHRLL